MEEESISVKVILDESLFFDSDEVIKVKYDSEDEKVKLTKAHTIQIYARCHDLFEALIVDKNGKTIAECEGYVPEFLGDGDSVCLSIELKTGKIIGWKAPSIKKLEQYINGEDEE